MRIAGDRGQRGSTARRRVIRTRSTRTPENAAARSLSPVAISVRPNDVRISSTARMPIPIAISTAYGICRTTSRPSKPAAAGLAERRATARRSVRRRSTTGRRRTSTSIMPSVVMNDGTFSSVVISPLTRPTRTPKPSISRITGTVRESSPSISLAAITTCAPTSEPTDRSNSPDTMTKYWPAARITSGAAFLTNAISDGGSAKLGVEVR